MQPHSACTSILVGKAASIDGSVMIARNDDTLSPHTTTFLYAQGGSKSSRNAKINPKRV